MPKRKSTAFNPTQIKDGKIVRLRKDGTIKAILESANTGEVGDGKLFVSDINECYRIRTGEKGGNTLK